jgi:hypothetical protein
MGKVGFDVYAFIEETAQQLAESIAELHNANYKMYALTKSVLMGIYTQGYRDANMERELNKKEAFMQSVQEFKDLHSK